MRSATRRIRSASATEDPPYFCTTSATVVLSIRVQVHNRIRVTANRFCRRRPARSVHVGDDGPRRDGRPDRSPVAVALVDLVGPARLGFEVADIRGDMRDRPGRGSLVRGVLRPDHLDRPEVTGQMHMADGRGIRADLGSGQVLVRHVEIAVVAPRRSPRVANNQVALGI
jgi:hypothetical protein